MQAHTDIDLLVAIAQRQDHEAFTELYQRYWQPAYNLAFHFVPNRALAEDAVQEAMLSIWETASMFRPEGSAQGWILSQVATRSLKLSRSRKRSQKREESTSARAHSGSKFADSAGLEKEELLQALRDQVQKLPDLERQILALYYGAELPQQEIGKLLSIPRPTISAKIQNVLERLKIDLTKAGFASLAPLLHPAALNEALLSGHTPSPDLHEKVMRRIAQLNEGRVQGQPRIAAQSSRHAVSRKAGAAVLFLAGAVGASVLSAGAFWWSYGTHDDKLAKTTSVPVAQATYYRTWDFNTPELPKDIIPVQDNWHWVAHGGADGSGCMETDSDIFTAVLNIPFPKLPILITCRTKTANPYVTSFGFGWSQEQASDQIGEVVSSKAGEWYIRRVFITEKFDEHWLNNQVNSFRLVERKEGAVLRFTILGKRLIDDFTIREIPSNEVPDVSKYLAAIEKIAPDKRIGKVTMPELRSEVSGKPLSVIFYPALDGFSQNANLPKEPQQASSVGKPIPTLFSRTWTFDTPEAPQDIVVLQGSWHFMPKGGPYGSGCMETETEDFAAYLNIPAQPFPLFLTFGILPLEGDWMYLPLYPKPTGLKPQGLAEISFPQMWAHSLIWNRACYYLTSEYSDVWNNAARMAVWVGPKNEFTPLGFQLKGRFRINNLTVRALLPGELPDVSKCLAAVGKIAPPHRVGTLPLPEVKSDLPGVPVTVRFIPPPEGK